MNSLEYCADDLYKDEKTSYFVFPTLDVSLEFPQATPVSIFPPCSKFDISSIFMSTVL